MKSFIWSRMSCLEFRNLGAVWLPGSGWARLFACDFRVIGLATIKTSQCLTPEPQTKSGLAGRASEHKPGNKESHEHDRVGGTLTTPEVLTVETVSYV